MRNLALAAAHIYAAILTGIVLATGLWTVGLAIDHFLGGIP